jgi:chondroitin 4-sulfotransferase 11
MPLSYEHKFIFVHIPKTAGTSIEKALNLQQEISLYKKYKYKNYPVCPQHLFLSEIIKEIPTLKSFSVFTVVRNPFDRFVSVYLHFKKNFWAKEFFNLNFEKFINICLKLPIAERRYKFDGHLEIQQNYLDYNLPIHIFKFEELNNKSLEEWLYKNFNLKINLSHENKTLNKLPYKEYYTKQSLIDKVAEFYAKDLESFFYKF